MKTRLLTLSTVLGLVLLAPIASGQSLDILEDPPPQSFFFRMALSNKASNPSISQSDWLDVFDRLHGINDKVLPFEIAGHLGNEYEILEDFLELKAQNPSQALLLHMNGRSIDPAIFARDPMGGYPVHYEVLDGLNAGHFLYFPGAELVTSIDDDDIWLEVDRLVDSSQKDLFSIATGLGKNVQPCANPGPGDPLNCGVPDNLCIVPYVNGTYDWDNAEHVILEEIDESGLRLRVTRNQFVPPGTSGLSFTGGEARILPHAWGGPWGISVNEANCECNLPNNLLWRLNLSSDAYANPQPGSGETARSILSRFLSDSFDDDDFLGEMDGIEFDVASWSVDGGLREVDLDLDFVSDGGIINNVNEYGVGVLSYYKTLSGRNSTYNLPAGKLLLADFGGLDSQRAVGSVLSGCEAEFIGEFADTDFSQWSWGLNRHGFWNAANLEPDQEFFYGVAKGKTTPTYADTRLMMATYVMMDAAPIMIQNVPPKQADEECFDVGSLCFGIIDELQKGQDRELNWLGEAVGPVVRLAERAPDLLAGVGTASYSQGFEDLWQDGTSEATFSSNSTGSDDVLTITPDPGTTPGNEVPQAKAYLQIPDVPAGDLTVFFQIWADPLEGFPDEIPRFIRVRAENLDTSAVFPAASNNASISHLKTLANPNPFRASFYFRDIGPGDVELEFDIEGEGDVYISRFTAHAATDAIAREFENGVVLANPAAHAVTLSLRDLFPERKLRRLQANTLQDPITNNGDDVDDTVTLPMRDGLFLAEREMARPVAEFDVAPTYATDTDDITFTDRSTNGPSTWEWYLDDGTTPVSTAASFTTTLSEGVHTMTLVARNDHGAGRIEKRNVVVIADSPSATTFQGNDAFLTSPVGDPAAWSFRAWAFDDYRALTDMGTHFEDDEYSDLVIYPTAQQSDVYEATRVWTSPNRGWADVTIAKEKLQNGGDGLFYSVLNNGSPILGPQYVKSGATSPETLEVGVGVDVDDVLEFRTQMANLPDHDPLLFDPDVVLTWGGFHAPGASFAYEITGHDGTDVTYAFTDTSTFQASPGTMTWDWDFGTTTSSAAAPPTQDFAAGSEVSVSLTIEDGTMSSEVTQVIRVPSVLADSIGDYPASPQAGTGSQGDDGWYYFGQDADTLEYDLMSYNTSSSRFELPGASYPYLKSATAHPGVISGVGVHSVRGWLCPADGVATIRGEVRKANTNGGDGVDASIVRLVGATDPADPEDGVEVVIWGPVHIEFDDNVGYTFDLETPVADGDLILLRLDAHGTLNSDGSFFDAQIFVEEPPKLDFTASPTSGAAPLTVDFTDLSDPKPIAWEWDFDNDGVIDSTDENPQDVVFSTIGGYNVRLRALYADGTIDELKLAFITAGIP